MFLMEHFQEGGWGMYPILLLWRSPSTSRSTAS